MKDLIQDYWTAPPDVPSVDWQKEYSKQRRDRLGDILLDYLTDDKVDARRCYEEILGELDALARYHQGQLDKANDLRSLLLGYRDPFGEAGTITFGG